MLFSVLGDALLSSLFLLYLLYSLSEKAMAPHSSTLAWKIPWTEKPGGLYVSIRYLPSAIQGTQVRSLGQQDLLEKGRATRSSILTWRIP